jgi:hypothetical protein
MDPLVTDQKHELREVSRRHREIMDKVTREVSIMEQQNTVLRDSIESNLVAKPVNGNAPKGIIPPTE